MRRSVFSLPGCILVACSSLLLGEERLLCAALQLSLCAAQSSAPRTLKLNVMASATSRHTLQLNDAALTTLAHFSALVHAL